MKYKVGDKVRIVKEKKERGWNIEGLMDKWLGEVMTISSIGFYSYSMEEDKGKWSWFEHMIEGKVTEMKKSDLIAGKHVVETREGGMYLVFDSKEGKFMYGTNDRLMDLEKYHEDLTKMSGYENYDITKVYEFKSPARRYSVNKYSEQCLMAVSDIM